MYKKLIKISLASLLLSTSLFSNDLDLKWDGVTIDHKGSNDNEIQEYIIKRIDNEECRNINGADPDIIWGGSYSNKNINNKCKKTFITTAGRITPIKINDNIKTYGEIEVIEFIQKSQTNKNMLLIDARLPNWFLTMSIPTAQNIPFTYFDPKKYPDNFYDVLKMLGVKVVKDMYNFKNAKELLLYCNGSWCSQSTFAIENLIKIGYPQDKISWYRGGMYSWKMLNLTTVN